MSKIRNTQIRLELKESDAPVIEDDAPVIDAAVIDAKKRAWAPHIENVTGHRAGVIYLGITNEIERTWKD